MKREFAGQIRGRKCMKRYMRDPVKIYCGPKDSGEILDKLKCDQVVYLWFSTLYTTLPHILIKDKLIDLIERTFNRKGSPYIACNDRNFGKPNKYDAWSC